MHAQQVLEQEVKPLVKGFKDTPFIVYMLKKNPKYIDCVYFEQEVGFNRHWLQVCAASRVALGRLLAFSAVPYAAYELLLQQPAGRRE